MLSVAALLNPDKSVALPRGTPLPSSPTNSAYTTSSPTANPHLSESSLKKQKMLKDGAVFTKGKIMGVVTYPPFEQLNPDTLEEVERFRIYPLGKIAEYYRHIPYNSEKKTFLEKTGRESFEVFQYTFKLPREDREYTVMWDYNIGLVRITPFFKCCNYSKTTPAKMLNMNPGLKQITHSITGGALAAQGYWMPYTCAYAVCATFCAQIAPALIPIFGPDFPQACTPIEAPEYRRMVIDASIIQSATIEADNYREMNGIMGFASTPPTSIRNSFSPHLSAGSAHPRPVTTQLSSRLRVKRALDEYTMGTPTETDMDTVTCSESSEGGRFTPLSCARSPDSLAPQSGWRAANMESHASNSGVSSASQQNLVGVADPWLSSTPRSTAEAIPGVPAVTWTSTKRRNDDVDHNADYDVQDSSSVSEPNSIAGIHTARNSQIETARASLSEREKTAALAMMQLHMQGWETGQRCRELDSAQVRLGLDAQSERGALGGLGPKLKKRKGTSV